jgi:hypothetical protein
VYGNANVDTDDVTDDVPVVDDLMGDDFDVFNYY